jgi:hypothetical protein
VSAEPYGCAACGGDARPSAPGNWREVTGWVEERRAGGAHAVRDPRPTGRYLCRFCMADRERGVCPGQGALL